MYIRVVVGMVLVEPTTCDNKFKHIYAQKTGIGNNPHVNTIFNAQYCPPMYLYNLDVTYPDTNDEKAYVRIEYVIIEPC